LFYLVGKGSIGVISRLQYLGLYLSS